MGQLRGKLETSWGNLGDIVGEPGGYLGPMLPCGNAFEHNVIQEQWANVHVEITICAKFHQGHEHSEPVYPDPRVNVSKGRTDGMKMCSLGTAKLQTRKPRTKIL